jgi:hypothetical protein
MPLNKLENFIKNTEGRILYVNPNDLDASDSVDNQGNSLTRPFRTVQRALLESARFSWLKGNNNDITEKTTILLFPGEHIIDNRPGFALKKNIFNEAVSVSPGGTEGNALATFGLTLNSNFDITQEDNLLYKFNSVNGGVVVPRGTSIVGLDLRKTKLRAKYVPNPTDNNVNGTAIFRITGACYFWQFSFFDADENGLVYTDPTDFSSNNRSVPTFSHHKLTCFEYCDGVNIVPGFDLTDLDMYYGKVSNAFNESTLRDIDQKYPSAPNGFAKQRPEWEIVGAFASDPINVASIVSGNGLTPGPIVTVTTTTAHNLNAGTPIKVKGVVPANEYNISTKVATVISDTQFTYLLSSVPENLPAGPAGGLSGSSATITVETDTVSGASPYVFNVSLRSVWGMQGMHADGNKAAGFRSMVVAQFTAVSLQKDDRAFAKYNEVSREYDVISYSKVTGNALSSGASSTNLATVYHLDSGAVYRNGWRTSHIKISNDAFIQVVSVFAIGFTKHFDAQSGGDGSITNSNSNFGQHSLAADGFKKEAFDKDDKAFITSIIAPRAVDSIVESNIDWLSIDVGLTTSVGISSHLYIFGFNNVDVSPPILTQGYRIGARVGDKLYVATPSGASAANETKEASIFMLNNVIGTGSTVALGTKSSEKKYSSSPADKNTNIFYLGTHDIQTGEKIRIISNSGDLPENIEEHKVYYAIRYSSTELRVASSFTNATAATPVYIPAYLGRQLVITSRVSDKNPGEIGHPIQWDSINNGWYVHVNANNQIYTTLQSLGKVGIGKGIFDEGARTNVSFFKRYEDNRSLDEKLYKLRVVVPKELFNGRDPVDGFVIQESSSTNPRSDADFSLTSIGANDYFYNRNPRFISTCTYNSSTKQITITSELPHNLKSGDIINVKNVTSTTNTPATFNYGYNGTFVVSTVTDDKVVSVGATDVFGVLHDPGTFTNNVNQRNVSLPRFEKNNNQGNLFIYRTETITPYIYNVQDGVYYVYTLNGSNALQNEFTNLSFTQNLVNLYPQLDKDNLDDNPPATVSYAKLNPIGDVSTSDLKHSITRETVNKFYTTFDIAPVVTGVSTSIAGITTLTFNREHGLNSVVTGTIGGSGGSGYTNGTYYNVKLYSNAALTIWNGATAKVVVSGGVVTSVEVMSGGSGYTQGSNTLRFDTSVIGAGTGATYSVTAVGISTAVGNVVQITGVSTDPDAHYRINTIPSKNQISIAQTAGQIPVSVGSLVINVGPSVRVTTTQNGATTSGIVTFSCGGPHGLLKGNRFSVMDANNAVLQVMVVNAVNSVTSVNAKATEFTGTPRFLLKHGNDANDASADAFGENLGIRGVHLYDNEIMTLGESITDDSTFIVKVPNSGIGTTRRFPLGSYIQIDNEIMRITSSTLSGAGSNEISVIRGSMGSLKESHSNGSLIRKIKPVPVEFRRPSILRASGHTFEYMGYGPGNYSTGLPQVQNRTITEREDFLAQSQETACGSVVYTGMNSDGDFFIGNTKYSSASGEQTTFDIPVPTVTGSDPNRLSVVFDEVIVKERLLVEGGNSGQVLSQFDGPVTFSKELKMNNNVQIQGELKVFGDIEFESETQSNSKDTGSVVLEGGMGIEKNLFIGGNLGVGGTFSTGSNVNINGTNQSHTKDQGCLILEGGLGVEKNVNIGGQLRVTGITTFVTHVEMGDDDELRLGDADDLKIYHTGTHSYVHDAGTGDLRLLAGVFRVRNTADDEDMIVASQNGGVTIYHDNTARLATSNGGTGNPDAGVRVTGTLSATVDVVAYVSDERLKENIKPIENALEKVLSLSGFTYNFNDVAAQLGFNKEESQVGVSAQQIQAVLPEAVKPAPVDNNYLTVQYEKIVPLLIEAIKELSERLDKIENWIGK